MGATVNPTEYDGNRRLADTASGPVDGKGGRGRR